MVLTMPRLPLGTSRRRYSPYAVIVHGGSRGPLIPMLTAVSLSHHALGS